jgi:hypothetical protein
LGDQLESLIRRHRVLDKFATSWAELGTTVGRELRDQVGVSIPNS